MMNGRAVAAIGAGSLFVWSGIRGWSVLATLGSLVTGHQPSQTTSIPLTTGGSAKTGTASGGSSAIAEEAMKWLGHAYVFGGSPGVSGSQGWDCSSFVNWVASVRLGLPIPGYGPGKYRGTSHGPTTGQWAIWPGLQRVPRGSVQGGDIIVWAGHMGIATGKDTMVSALNHRVGTVLSPIDGYGTGPILLCGRYRG